MTLTCLRCCIWPFERQLGALSSLVIRLLHVPAQPFGARGEPDRNAEHRLAGQSHM